MMVREQDQAAATPIGRDGAATIAARVYFGDKWIDGWMIEDKSR